MTKTLIGVGTGIAVGFFVGFEIAAVTVARMVRSGKMRKLVEDWEATQPDPYPGISAVEIAAAHRDLQARIEAAFGQPVDMEA